MINKMNEIALSLFNAVLAVENQKIERDLKNELRILKSFNVIVLPEAIYAIKEISNYLENTRLNQKKLNATFYRSWDEVINKSDFQIIFDKVSHYASTYGSGFTSQELYIPAEYFELEPKSKEETLPLSFIRALSYSEIEEKIMKILSSGVALKQETASDLLTLLNFVSSVKKHASEIKNKEAKIIAAEKFGTIKIFDPSELIRYFIYKATGKTLLIKNNETIKAIIDSKLDISKDLHSYGFKLISESFNRYKPLYLAFKKAHVNNKSAINAISKLSKTEHKPMPVNPLNIVSQSILSADQIDKIREMPVQTLLRAYNVALLNKQHCDYSMFLIRNGKSWVREEPKDLDQKKIKIATINASILFELVKEKLSDKFEGKKFFIPEGIEYGLPLSEKQMCGNIPHNTIISTNETLAVGVFWDINSGVRDLDLSGLSNDGKKYGWDGYYSDNDNFIVYSGDMTSPKENGATEYLTLPKINGFDSDQSHIVEVCANRYYFCNSGSGDIDYKFNIIVGISSKNKISKSEMLNHSNLIFSCEKKTDKEAQTLGLLVKGIDDRKQFIFCPSTTSNMRVSKNNESRQIATREALLHKIKYSLTLNTLIEMLGGEIVRSNGVDCVSLSPKDLSKDFFEIFIG